MNYQEFLTDVTTAIEQQLGDSATLQLQSITKNNGTHLDGLIIMTDEVNISPTIYLNPYYHRFLDGVPLLDIYEDILNTYYTHKPTQNIDISFFTDYEKVKDRIIFKVVNYEKNLELLTDVPHFRHLDLAILFNCLVSTFSEDHATILIHNQHLTYWGVDADDLYQAALENTPRLLPSKFDNMADILSEMIAQQTDEPDEEDFDADPLMYVLTNDCKLNGASCILYDGLLPEISRQFEKNLIILPSSVHEVIVIPTDSDDEDESTLSAYAALVQEVNDTQVSDDEFLSNHAYFYNHRTQLVTISP